MHRLTPTTTLTTLLLPALLLLQACNASVAESHHDADQADANESTDYVAPDPADKVVLTEEQWQEKLTADQFYILRQDGTERPHSSPLNHEKRAGIFACAGCDNALYRSEHKYDSGTGWPSFDRPFADHHIEQHPENDRWNRIEVVCARCDGHLGHVFNDGPRDTTGKRHCINGDALIFQPTPDESTQDQATLNHTAASE